ncbi:hypothetical protein A2572_03800 [Candidatus Collierbacteria bacterium RIFOXYD1_FULL_40_9]|uniref:DUF5666 domain-containing protein n=1 Tax=Candidatus Collierbacteria bacterium RIFOXYD1_FULL_40_9 TaxID=1817731 RepID=A0A1F5FU80_9BACT|nr:MAG: hypothetical protein A2572_03800 [Candidatus Collierbacteria bacterium RIFOXYD1_FULL_40_9]
MTKKMGVLAGVGMVVAALTFSGCELVKGENSVTVDMTENEERPGVTLTGTVVQASGKFFLQTGGRDTEITSRRIDLMPHVGKSVEVHGEFSGTTLYLDSIK